MQVRRTAACGSDWPRAHAHAAQVASPTLPCRLYPQADKYDTMLLTNDREQQRYADTQQELTSQIQQVRAHSPAPGPLTSYTLLNRCLEVAAG